MSGHSKWHSIKHQKGVEDVKKGKIFSRHSKLIAIAARGGGDPDMNPALRAAIDNARAENTPRENIERAIKKGSGDDKNAAQMEEIIYEGFGPGGVALYIETLTDNKNRALTNIKNIMGKYGGAFGAAGSVGYLFKKQGLITMPVEAIHELSHETIHELPLLAAIDAGATDVKQTEEFVEIYTQPGDLMKIKIRLEKAGFQAKSASLIYVPQTEIHIVDKIISRKLLKLVEALEEDDDVATVYHNGKTANLQIYR